MKNRKVGKISDRKHHEPEKLSSQEEWKRLEKSLQKLKKINKQKEIERKKDDTIPRDSGSSPRNGIRKQETNPDINATTRNNRKIFMNYL